MNHEHYSDPTADLAVYRVWREERKKQKKLVEQRKQEEEEIKSASNHARYGKEKENGYSNKRCTSQFKKCKKT